MRIADRFKIAAAAFGVKMTKKKEVKGAPSVPEGVSPALARILRPQAAYRWLLPQLAAITPQYIEMTLRGALAGNHVQAWELFDLMEDTWPRLGKNLNELKHGVNNMKATFEPYAEDEQDPTGEAKEKCALVQAAIRNMKPVAQADENAFQATAYDILDAWGKGIAVMETDWHQFHSKTLGLVTGPRCTFWVHPVCYAFSQDGVLGLRVDAKGSLAPQATMTSQPMPSAVADFPADKFLVAIRKHKSGTALAGPMLRALAWWWCAANFSADWLLNLAQTFGLPFRWANYKAGAPQATIDAICNMLQNMGSSAWAAFPEGTTLDLKEAAGKGEHTPQGDMLDRADKNCDLIVLGQTLTSDTGGGGRGGGSLALGKVHSGVKDEIIQACARFVESVFNNQLFPSILNLNYGECDECPTLKLETEKEEDLVQKSEIVANLATSAGKAIPLSWINDAFNIPVPQDGEPTLGDVAAAQAAPPKPGGAGAGTTDPDEPAGPAVAGKHKAQAGGGDRLAERLEKILLIEDDAQFKAEFETAAKEFQNA